MEKQKSSNRSKLIKLVLSLVLTMVVAGSFMLGYFTRYWTMPPVMKDLFEVFDLTNKFYYGTPEATEEDYANALVREVLDEYCAYYAPDTYQNVTNNAQGKYQGVGISFLKAETAPIIYNVSGNSPAKKAGLKIGDKVIGGSNAKFGATTFTDKNDVLHFLDNTAMGETFSLRVTRDGVFEDREFSITVSKYIKTYVEYYDSENVLTFTSDTPNGTPKKTVITNDGTDTVIPDADTAYIKLVSFEGNAAREIGEALAFMKEQGRSKLVLDLINNGGGYLNVLADITAYFVRSQNSNPTIAYACDKDGVFKHFSSSTLQMQDHLRYTVVLANKHTASASEVLIGAMRHYQTIGEAGLVIVKNDNGVAKTYGKGIMQSTYKLSSGGALKLTPAKLYLPDLQTSIHGKGFVLPTDSLNAVDTNADALSRALAILREKG